MKCITNKSILLFFSSAADDENVNEGQRHKGRGDKAKGLSMKDKGLRIKVNNKYTILNSEI